MADQAIVVDSVCSGTARKGVVAVGETEVNRVQGHTAARNDRGGRCCGWSLRGRSRLSAPTSDCQHRWEDHADRDIGATGNCLDRDGHEYPPIVVRDQATLS